MNNFQILERDLAEGKEKRFLKIKNNINESKSLFQTIGDLVELFFPKFVETFVSMTGSQNNMKQNKYPHEN